MGKRVLMLAPEYRIDCNLCDCAFPDGIQGLVSFLQVQLPLKMAGIVTFFSGGSVPNREARLSLFADEHAVQESATIK